MVPFIGGFVYGNRSLGKKMSAIAASDAAAASSRLHGDLFELHDRIDRLTLVVGAMWSLLEESGYSTDDLVERLQQLDTADGAKDGKLAPAPTPCSVCGAMVDAGLPACQFCGNSNPGLDPLAAV